MGEGRRMAVEKPLGRVVRIRFWQAVGIALGSDLLPIGKVEGNLDKRSVRDLQRLVYLPYRLIIFWRGAETPDGREMGGIVRDDDGYVGIRRLPCRESNR